MKGVKSKWIKKSKALFAKLQIANITISQTTAQQVTSKLVTDPLQAFQTQLAKHLSVAVEMNANNINKKQKAHIK